MLQKTEKRINDRIQNYWESIRDGRPFPLEADVNPDDIDDIWDACFLVHVEDGGQEDGFKYTYLGQSLIEAYGDDVSNREVCERLVYPSSLPLAHKFREIVNTEAPVTEESEFTNTKGQLIKFRSCMLPLGKGTDGKVHYIIGGMKWKAF